VVAFMLTLPCPPPVATNFPGHASHRWLARPLSLEPFAFLWKGEARRADDDRHN